MTFYAPHWKVTVHGTMYGTETWSFSLRVARTEGEPVDADAESLTASWLNRWNTSGYCPKFFFVGVRIAQIETTGLQTPGTVPSQGFANGLSGVAGTGSATGVHWPPQATMVATLMTEATGGRARKGRVYLPPVCTDLGNDGRVSTTVSDLHRDNVVGFINSINAADWGGRVQVMSNLGGGFYNDVTAVRVGRVVDTQRRRRLQITEAPPAAVAIT